jgi:tyrosinase
MPLGTRSQQYFNGNPGIQDGLQTLQNSAMGKRLSSCWSISLQLLFLTCSWEALATTYIVQQGDSLYLIAQNFGISLVSLVAANSQINDPALIYPGEVVTVPSTSIGCFNSWTVEPGEYLYQIAQVCNLDLNCLEAANPQVCDPSMIYPGEVVAIPPSCSSTSSSASTAPAAAVSCGGDYVVSPGDDLYDIANKCKITLMCLEAANPQIADPNLIYPGEVIKVPKDC